MFMMCSIETYCQIMKKLPPRCAAILAIQRGGSFEFSTSYELDYHLKQLLPVAEDWPPVLLIVKLPHLGSLFAPATAVMV